MANRPSAVAFDVVETLMTLEPLAARFERAGLPASALREWFTRLLLLGMGLSAAGDYIPFPQVAAEALRAVGGYRLAEHDVELVMAGFAELPAHPDAEPALRTLAGAGLRLCCLTNGSADATAAFLDRTGLERYIERVISAAEVGPGSHRPGSIVTRRLFSGCRPRGSPWSPCMPGTATGPNGPD